MSAYRGRCRQTPTALALVALVLTPATAFSQSEDSCAVWHDSETDGPFNPASIEIRLGGDVGPDMESKLFGVLEDYLASYPTLKTIKLMLSSNGGYVTSGFRIHNYLRGLHERHGLQVVTHNTGSVQSAAVDVYCSGNQRIASPYSIFMVHDSSRELEGNYNLKDLQDIAEEDHLDTAASHQIFSSCTTVPVSEVGVMFADETYFDPDQALDLGLAHSIQPATFDRSADIRCQIEASDEEELVE
ncbi:MAG: ATP-dependent Clp protease proteolytic subunit [Pseudomonadota bacterium]